MYDSGNRLASMTEYDYRYYDDTSYYTYLSASRESDNKSNFRITATNYRGSSLNSREIVYNVVYILNNN